MTMRKRVTVTVELIEPMRSEVVWSHTETAEHATGDNPEYHWSDVQAAADESVQHSVQTVAQRFGKLPAQPLGVRAGARLVTDMNALQRAAGVVTA